MSGHKYLIGLVMRNTSKTIHANMIQIKGCIFASEFNRHGKIQEIMLETEDFKRYVIIDDLTGRQLFDRLYDTVIVQGTIDGANEYGQPMVRVSRYNIVEGDSNQYR